MKSAPASPQTPAEKFQQQKTYLAVLARLRAHGKLAPRDGPPAVLPNCISQLTEEERAALVSFGAVVYTPVVTLAQHLQENP